MEKKYEITSRPVSKSLLTGSKKQNALAAIMIILLVVCVGVRLWALSVADRIFVPDQVASNGKIVCVHFNGALFLLTPEGRLRKSINLTELGITGEPADIEILKDGSLLVGDYDRGEILKCDTEKRSCQRIGPAGEYTITDNFKFLVDEERNLLFIADTNNNSVMFQDMEGSYISEVKYKTKILYPNDMVLGSDGRLWLSNTKYGRVVSFSVENEMVVESEDMIKLRPQIKGLENMKKTIEEDPPDALGDFKALMEKMKETNKEKEKFGKDLVHTRPLALAQDYDDNLWVVAGDGLITTAGVRVFDPEGEQVKRINLGHGEIPVDITLAGENMLIADSGLFEIFSVNTGTGDISEFGDEAFLSEISRVRNELRYYEAIKLQAGRGIWFLALGTIILIVFIIAGNSRARTVAARSDKTDALSGTRVQAPAGIQTAGAAKNYRLKFTGSGSEYFRIWIVNTFLTIATLGIYAAWAKVRTRRYFYRNTILDGHAFDYTADPKVLLKGYAIVGAGLAVYYLSQAFVPAISLIIMGLFAVIFPLLIYKSLKFFARNSVYRNIRLRFIGSLGDSYRAYLLYPLLIPFTLGLIIPYWAFLRKKYFFHNLAYGETDNSFTGSHGPFYKVYILSSLAVSGVVFISIIVMSIFMAGMTAVSSTGTNTMIGSTVFVIVLTYLSILIMGTFLQQYIYAWELNYCLEYSELGELRFNGSLSGVKLCWIRISNIFAIIFSIGLLIPWAKVRRTRYIFNNITVTTDRDLNDFTAAVQTDESAYGDAATDFFDFDIGL